MSSTWLGEKIEKKVEDLAAAVVVQGEQTRAELVSGLAETKRGLRIDGAASKPFRANNVNYHTGRRLVGWSLRAAGGAVVVTFRDGLTADAEPIGAVCLADGQSETVTAMPAGVTFVDALYAEVTGAGTVVGAVWLGAVD